MKFTTAARTVLDSLPLDDQARIGNWAKRIAAAEPECLFVHVRHIRAAQMLAGEEFLPGDEGGDTE